MDYFPLKGEVESSHTVKGQRPLSQGLTWLSNPVFSLLQFPSEHIYNIELGWSFCRRASWQIRWIEWCTWKWIQRWEWREVYDWCGPVKTSLNYLKFKTRLVLVISQSHSSMFISWFIIFVFFLPVLFVSVFYQANSNDLDFEWIISMMCLV